MNRKYGLSGRRQQSPSRTCAPGTLNTFLTITGSGVITSEGELFPQSPFKVNTFCDLSLIPFQSR